MLGVPMDMDDISSIKPVLAKSTSDKFILDNNLNLQETADVVKFLLHEIGVLAPYNSNKPYQADFLDNCLEFRLDVRQTTYQLDNNNDIKIQLAVSGAGKTRKLLELLYSQTGYYFVIDLQLADFGSGDMAHCYQYSVNAPEKIGYFIELLYFVRVFVCNYLIGLGYTKPNQILLAQLHPKQFFGIDIFKELFDSLAKRSHIVIGRKIEECFDFVAIDEIQRSLEGKLVFNLPGSINNRPFFSPLVYHSKLMGKFPKFIVSGTGINFNYIQELMLSFTFKTKTIFFYQVISDFQPLSKEQTEQYITFILSEHSITPEAIAGVVDLIANNKLFLGRGRFIAFLLENYLVDKDIDLALSKFISALGDPKSHYFPLKFYKEDLQHNRSSFDKVIGGSTLGSIVCDGLIQYMLKGHASLYLDEQATSDAVRYGIGFCTIEGGVIRTVEMKELAVIECLRYLTPFSYVAKTIAKQLSSYPQPQMVGIMLEYLVGYAFVANFNPTSNNQISTFIGSVTEYLNSDNSQHEVYFPDHCLGPDILYKHQGILYIIQVKFVKIISKQERVNACHTTDPNFFYWNKRQNCVLNGYQERKDKIIEVIRTMSHESYVFLHSNTKTIAGMENVNIINQRTEPQFFDNLSEGMWELLNKIREGFS